MHSGFFAPHRRGDRSKRIRRVVLRLVSSSPLIRCTSSWLNDSVRNVPSRPGFLGCSFAHDLVNLARQFKMLGIRRSINQKGPIDITAGRELVPASGPKTTTLVSINAAPPAQADARSGDVAPPRPEASLQLSQVRRGTSMGNLPSCAFSIALLRETGRVASVDAHSIGRRRAFPSRSLKQAGPAHWHLRGDTAEVAAPRK